MSAVAQPTRSREHEILDAVLVVLARDGIGGVSMRVVAREAEVSLGLANYYFTDKTSLIAAALRRVGEQDLTILDPMDDAEPMAQLRRALRRVVDHEFLESRYLSLRLQLWSLAAVDDEYAAINRDAQQGYLRALATLIAAADLGVGQVEAMRRAAAILVVQNGLWLTSAILPDGVDIARGVEQCEQIAFGSS